MGKKGIDMKFTQEVFNRVKNLEKKTYIKKVTEKTEDGIYTFRGYENVAIWDTHVHMTGTKANKREIRFNFCLGSYNFKVGGNYVEGGYSRQLRVDTGTTDVDTRVTKKK